MRKSEHARPLPFLMRVRANVVRRSLPIVTQSFRTLGTISRLFLVHLFYLHRSIPTSLPNLKTRLILHRGNLSGVEPLGRSSLISEKEEIIDRSVDF